MSDGTSKCADCGQATDGQCVWCARSVCDSCAESRHHCPALDG
jgi:hypothetical protein